MMRKKDAHELRATAARIARERPHPVHVADGEERAYRESHSFMSFTKGLPHHLEQGLARDALDPVRLRTAIDSGYSRDFDLSVPLGDRNTVGDLVWHFYDSSKNPATPVALQTLPDGEQHRRWEAPTAGWVFELEGPDAQAVTMPPAPPIVVQVEHASYGTGPGHDLEANPELIAEMAEVYWLACLRDQPFAAFDEVSRGAADPGVDEVGRAVSYLERLPFYEGAGPHHPRRRYVHQGESLSRQNVFRGHTPGERKGPYLSQFMLIGNRHLGAPYATDDGFLQYGSIRADMRVRVATPCKDYMTHWNEWLDVQNGANVRDAVQTYVEAPDPEFRFIATPRDLATYVHFDALYEAYLNACLWLWNVGAPVDPNFRHLLAKTRHTEGFALFGGPQILSLMTEVATRGLKAVRFQKFNVHLRLRPEALAGLVAAHHGGAMLPEGAAAEHVKLFHDALDVAIGGTNILGKVGTHNQTQNAGRHDTYLDGQTGIAAIDDLPLLPMAFRKARPCTRPTGRAMPRSPERA